MSSSITSNTFNLPRLDSFLALLSGEGLSRTAGRWLKTFMVPLFALLLFLFLWDIGDQGFAN